MFSDLIYKYEHNFWNQLETVHPHDPLCMCELFSFGLFNSLQKKELPVELDSDEPVWVKRKEVVTVQKSLSFGMCSP